MIDKLASVQRSSSAVTKGRNFKSSLQDAFCMGPCPLCAPVDSGEWRQKDGPLAAGVLPHPGVAHLPGLPLCGLGRSSSDEKPATC
ncbi:hypothetical protein AMECASPLE_007337 [Ameca splendens]|uniref:Uncharacterized protein n=1 Tax=Ameca splendens TaxID=208324 RepID=A0ABV0ZVM8_9TELE